MARIDLTNYLTHWVKSDTEQEAYRILSSIIVSGKLYGGNGHIKGKYTCICFTETPEKAFQESESRYQPFEIQVPKSWIFEQGGRPVIYQSDNEFDALPESIRWRHVRYEPNADSPIDFTWEREWRIQTNELDLPTDKACVIVPDASWVTALVDEHMSHESFRIYEESIAYGDAYMMQDPEDNCYNYSVINTET